MATTARPDEGFGSDHDRSERERDVLRELHELTGRPGPGEPPPIESGREIAGKSGDPPGEPRVHEED